MVFKCQEDSFLKEWSARVTAIELIEQTEADKKAGFNVILEDTILFPEGGGQPCDHGFLNKQRVEQVVRRGGEALHFIESASPPFEVGQTVKQKVDWPRRHDHMQQHSGQHLITAIFDRDFKFNTKAWWLGSETSYIELEAPDEGVSQAQLDQVEEMANRLIAAATPVRVNVYEPDDPALTSEVTRATRGLPEDLTGPLRVVTIEGVESNMCCGTHVSNLAQLQVVKLLNAEKAKGKLLVHFLVGDRVIRKLRECFDREQQMNTMLNGGPTTHIDLIRKLQTNFKAAQRLSKSLAKEVALAEVNKFKSLPIPPKHYSLHRSDGTDTDFINTFLRNVAEFTSTTFFFITLGDDTNKAQLTLLGPPEAITALGQPICRLLDGKGNGKGSRFQAKVNSLKNLAECERLIAECERLIAEHFAQ